MTSLADRRLLLDRRLLFRLGAIVVGLFGFAALEFLLILCGIGAEDYRYDPFVGFDAIHPLFQYDAETDQYQIARSRQAFFRPDSFSATKDFREYRIFCIGGSTVQGEPFSIETSFTTWLRLALEAADPERPWEVVNCGGISYASYRLAHVLQEILRYQPDLVILYTGHNEFLEERTYRHIKYQSPAVRWMYRFASSLRTYRLLHEGIQSLSDPARMGRGAERRPVLGGEVDATLDYEGGLEAYRRDAKWRRDVIAHYRYNLQRMVHMAKAAGVPLILINPVSNLRSCPPFKSEHREGLTHQEHQKWQALFDAARKAFRTNKRHSIDLLQRAIAVDDQHAGIHYTLAKCYEDLRMFDQARSSYLRAKELDICPLRILEPMNRAVLEVAHETETPLVDARRLIEQHSRDGIPGRDLMIDHVHPTFRGHQLIADALAEELARQRVIDPPPDWQTRRRWRYDAHFVSLDDHYFLKGEEHLRALRGWAAGRARQLRPSHGK